MIGPEARRLIERKLPGPVARRGLVWEPNADFTQSRLFVPTSKGVYALGAADGQVRVDFGVRNSESGKVLSVVDLVD